METQTTNRGDINRVIAMLQALRGITPTDRLSQVAVLMAVAARPGIIIGELQDAANVSQQAASRIARELSDARGRKPGMAVLSVDRAADERIKPLRLTTHGKRVVEAALEAIAGRTGSR